MVRMKGLFYFVAIAGAGLLIFGGQALVKAQIWIKQITVKFIAVGRPSLSLHSQFISLPVQLELTNPSPIPVPVQNLKVIFNVLQNGNYIKTGETNKLGAFTFQPGINNLVVTPTVDLKALNPFDDGFSLDNFLDAIGSGDLADVRLDLEITVSFVPFTIPIYTKIKLNSLLPA